MRRRSSIARVGRGCWSSRWQPQLRANDDTFGGRGVTLQVPPPTPNRRSSRAERFGILQSATWIWLESASASGPKRPRWLQKLDTYAVGGAGASTPRKRQKRCQAHHRQPAPPDGLPAQPSSTGTPPATGAQQLGPTPWARPASPRTAEPGLLRGSSSRIWPARSGDPVPRFNSWSFSGKSTTTTRTNCRGRRHSQCAPTPTIQCQKNQ